MSNQGYDLTIRNVTLTARGGRLLLDIPALSVPAGRALGIRGASGAGKSTFLQAVMGLAPVDGQVLWGATDLTALDASGSARFRRTHMGMIFQDFLLFDELDAGGNAGVQALFSPKAARAELRQAARAMLGQQQVDSTAPNVAHFSGGERQRVALARALAHSPGIVLADEPTASLHRDAGDQLTETLLAHAADTGATLLVASHDEALLSRMDEVVTLDHGRITS